MSGVNLAGRNTLVEINLISSSVSKTRSYTPLEGTGIVSFCFMLVKSNSSTINISFRKMSKEL